MREKQTFRMRENRMREKHKHFVVPQNHHHHNPHNELVKYISTPYIPGTSEIAKFTKNLILYSVTNPPIPYSVNSIS